MRPGARTLAHALEGSQARGGNSLGPGSPEHAAPRLTQGWQSLPSVTSLSKALLNTVAAEAAEPLCLEVFCRLLSGALSLGLSTAEKRGKVCLKEGLHMCRGGAATHSCFPG